VGFHREGEFVAEGNRSTVITTTVAILRKMIERERYARKAVDEQFKGGFSLEDCKVIIESLPTE
jgi:hypothetical protein